MLRCLPRFRRDRSGVAATEFAVIMPLAIFAILAEFDMYRYVMATQRLEVLAESVAQMLASPIASTTAATTGDGVVSDWDINFAMNSAYFLYPDILTSPAVQQGAAWWQALEVDTAAIKMTLQDDGTYKPVTAWHGTNQTSGNTRQCGATYALVADTSVSSPTTLPTDLVGPNSLIVVDVTTTFQPTFGANYLPSMTIRRSVYMPPRNVPFVEYQGSGWMAVNC
jgi:Flp pilus assembly protein TadG